MSISLVQNYYFLRLFVNAIEVMKCLAALTCIVLSQADTYSEQIRETKLENGQQLIQFEFFFEANSTSSHLLNVFPQSVASVLFQNGTQSINGAIARGRWKAHAWGETQLPVSRPGSSMVVTADSPTAWTQTAWLLSASLGASFETLSPEQKSLPWITPMDLPNRPGNKVTRVGSNPNEQLCTDNLERLVSLLPCRGRAGVASALVAIADELARSEFVSIVLSATKEGLTKTLSVHVYTVVGTHVLKSHPSTQCPAVNGSPRQLNQAVPSVTVSRSLVMSPLGPERRYGRQILKLSNPTNVPKTVEYFEQIPFFLVPLMHTYAVTGDAASSVRDPSTKWSDGHTSPTYMQWTFVLPPTSSATISLDIYKKFIPMSKFGFSFEKGFDIGSAVYRVDGEVWFTRGLVTVVPLPDHTSTFNVLAVAATTMAVFFSMFFRNFASKRSSLIDSKHATDHDPPLFRMLTWMYVNVRAIPGKLKALRRQVEDLVD